MSKIGNRKGSTYRGCEVQVRGVLLVLLVLNKYPYTMHCIVSKAQSRLIFMSALDTITRRMLAVTAPRAVSVYKCIF